MKQLYKIPLPEASAQNQSDELGTVLSELGVLDGDAIVEAQSSEAADLSLSGEYRYGEYFSRLLATELEELANSSLNNLPLFRIDGTTAAAGYYEIRSATVNPAHPTGRAVFEYDLDLTKVGTRKTHWLGVTTQPSQPDPGHSFGNETTGLVGIPAAARRVRAINSTSSPTQRDASPTPVATVAGEHGDVDLYDATAASFDNPIYIYDLPHSEVAALDVHLYDTRDKSSKFIESADGRVRQWETIFDPAHEFEGDAVLSNTVLRLTITEPAGDDGTGSLTAERWDDANSAWSSVSLPATDWAPLDLDVVSIEQAVVTAQLAFEATADTTDASAGDVYELDVHLLRGYDDAQFWIPQSVSDPIPTDLEDHLDPIADESVVEPGTEQTLVARSEVRK